MIWFLYFRYSIINEKNNTMAKKFERDTEQKHPTNPTGKTNKQTNEFDIDKKTIKKQQNKK
ncbi:MAG: hypothetical protein COA40_02400 [Aequorivita sp.]|nr:MAG: hypothetical protein COA40_02400 [Aequorivita sp.]